LHLRFSGLVEDRRHALGFGEREERPLHEVAPLPRRRLAGSASNESSVARSLAVGRSPAMVSARSVRSGESAEWQVGRAVARAWAGKTVRHGGWGVVVLAQRPPPPLRPAGAKTTPPPILWYFGPVP